MKVKVRNMQINFSCFINFDVTFILRDHHVHKSRQLTGIETYRRTKGFTEIGALLYQIASIIA